MELITFYCLDFNEFFPDENFMFYCSKVVSIGIMSIDELFASIARCIHQALLIQSTFYAINGTHAHC